MSEVSRAQDQSFFILSLFLSDPITTNNNIVGSSWSALVNKMDFDDCERFLRKYPAEARDSSGRYQETFETYNFCNKFLTQIMHFL